jgi:GT2 family glycosyltransferase
VTCENRGFGHANNRAFVTTDARYVLFLNPDTEILDGTFAGLVEAMDSRPDVGLVGVRQRTPAGELFPTIRRFPSVSRYFFEALASERFPVRASWLGERELDWDQYDKETDCDWTSGSFMLARRDAIRSAGCLDERFFIYSEEVDFCLRIRQAGWRIVHLPTMTILHHADKAGFNPRMMAQDAFARRQYLRKHFTRPRRVACTGALFLRYGLRALPLGAERDRVRERRKAALAALRVLVGVGPAPFGDPPQVAFAPDRQLDVEHADV